MTIGWPMRSERPFETTRATMSVALPAENPTYIRIGLEGYGCAADSSAASDRTAAATASIFFISVLLWESFSGRDARAHLHSGAGRHPRLHRVDELAQIGSRFARVDHVLDRESLRSQERRRKRTQLGFDFLEALFRVRRLRDLAPEGRGHAALDRQGTPFGARPGDLEVEPLAIGGRHAGHAIALADHHGQHRHRGLARDIE